MRSYTRQENVLWLVEDHGQRRLPVAFESEQVLEQQAPRHVRQLPRSDLQATTRRFWHRRKGLDRWRFAIF